MGSRCTALAVLALPVLALLASACGAASDLRPLPDTISDTAPPTDGVADTDTVTDADPDGRTDTPADTTVDPETAPTLPPFSYATSCLLPPDPSTGERSVQLFDPFPDLPGETFTGPIFLTVAGDGSHRLFAVEQDGRILVFENRPEVSSAELFLDIRDRVEAGGEEGLLGLAFHPAFASNGRFFLNSTRRGGGKLATVISEMQVSAGNRDKADPGSERIILRFEQPFGNHNGGMLAFGPDGHLYIGVGDGGSGGDPFGHGQNPATLLGAMLRIDVDGGDGGGAGEPYGIPPDNPFAAAGPGRPEVWAWGLRNPWRFSFDRLTGALWAADVGQGNWEEIDVVEGGRNYGWNVREGSRCFPPGTPACASAGLVMPLLEYSHAEGQSVTGGYVYRGGDMPSQQGVYFYADFVSQRIFAWDFAREGAALRQVAMAPFGVTSFGQDHRGEVYVLGFGLLGAKKILRLREAEGAPLPEAFPRTLSRTGCFEGGADLDPAPGVLPYSVNAPRWSNGATAERYLVLPPGGKISLSGPGKWGLPAGTTLIEHLSVERVAGDPDTRVRVETRLLVREAAGQVRGYSYRWNDAGTEATLLDGADTRDLEVTLPGGGGPTTLLWTFPSRGQCRACHTGASGGILGLSTAQLNRERSYSGVSSNQLLALDAWGLLANPLPAPPGALPAFPALDDGDASLAHRARAYLHTNCAPCHLPGGPTGTGLDLRFGTPLSATGACDTLPDRGDLGVSAARILAPGHPERSVLLLRLSAAAPWRMPPLDAGRPHEAAAAVIGAWIQGLADCSN